MLQIKRPQLSVIIPVFNERKTVEQAVRSVYQLPVDKEIIVIDDYSTDGSRELLKKLQTELQLKLILHSQNRGKGYGVRNAAAYAKGRYLIVEDADLELDINAVPEMLNLAEKDPSIDMINGNRVLKKGKKSGLLTKLAKIITSFCTRILFGKYIEDILCSYKLCRLEKFKQLHLQSTRFGFETEWIVKALKNNWKILEYKVEYTPRLHKEGKKINLFDGFEIIWQLIKYRFSKT